MYRFYCMMCVKCAVQYSGYGGCAKDGDSCPVADDNNCTASFILAFNSLSLLEL